MAKRFFFVSAGVLCLMLAAAIGFHMGSATAKAQNSPTMSPTIAGFAIDGTKGNFFVIGPDGTVYQNSASLSEPAWVKGHYWNGSTVPTNESTWGATKQEFKPKD